MLSSEQQYLADLFKYRPESPEALNSLIEQIARILHLLPPDFATVSLSAPKTGLYLFDLTEGERRILLYNRQGVASYVLVVDVQQNIDDSKRKSWPIYGWSAFRATGLPSEVIVIAPIDSVARWAQEPIIDGRNSFRVHVIGRHNLPVITDEHEAKDKPLLALLSAGVHLQSSTPPAGSSQSQADKDREAALQLKVADQVATSIGFPDYSEVFLKRMARENSGPILTSIERRALEVEHRALAEMVEIARGIYSIRFPGEQLPEEYVQVASVAPEELRTLIPALAIAPTSEEANQLIREAHQRTRLALNPSATATPNDQQPGAPQEPQSNGGTQTG